MKNLVFIGYILAFFSSLPTLANALSTNLNQSLTPQQMKQDVNAWRDWLSRTHPDVNIRISDLPAYEAMLAKIDKAITQPMTTKAFLAEMASLNSLFNDGHMNILVESQTRLVKAIIKEGRGLFPFEVIVSDGKVYIASELGGATSAFKMAEITHIDGQPIASIYEDMIARMYGDTVAHRESLLSDKFALYYWLFIKPNEQFSISVRQSGETKLLTAKAVKSLPVALAKESFEELFKFEVLEQQQALLTINLFWWEDKERFYQFTQHAFEQLKEQGIKHLIIDIRANPGGDDDMWKQGILRYIADKPYRHTSRYIKKIIAKYMDEGETEGDVVTADYDKFEVPETDEPLRFNGDVSVVVGEITYSSAIVFANTIQDFEFGQVVGEKSAGYSWQTGGIQFFTFPNSGLKAVSPRFYLVRPSGEGKGKQVIPDTLFKDDALNPGTLINTIVHSYSQNGTI